MAEDMFLKIQGVDGESKDHAHKNEFDVLAWSWGLTQSGTANIGGGSGGGRVSVQDVNVTKYMDKGSPTIMLHCASGKHFPQAILTVRKAGGDAPVEYYKITMDQVLITSYQTGGSGSEDRLTENVTLNFAKVKTEYTEQTETGGRGGTNDFGWDVAQNKSM